MDLGADEITTFFRVTLPLIFPGIVSGALLVFTLSLDDYVITSFVAGVGSTTLPLQIYSMVKQGISPEINAVSTVLLALTITLVAISHMLQKRAP
jgi:spermidine/putrescine transport system permease protein